MIRPATLQQGDTIGIIAPARKISREELKPSIELLQSWGLNVRLGKNLFGAANQFSGTDEERTADLQEMLDDVSVKAVIGARGGYGTIRIIDRVDFSRFIRSPKWIIGYSDITVLHARVNELGIESLHATMPINFEKDQESLESLKNILFGTAPEYSWEGNPLNRNGKAEGELTGGNLSLIYAMAGSKTDLDTKGKILFLEDLDEYLYHIDRMMMNLKRSGKLDQIAGLVVGGMTDMKDNSIPFGKTAEEIILDAVKEYDFPVSFGLPAGHTTRNLALIMGRKVKIEAGQTSKLTFH